MDEELQQLRDERTAAETALHETRQSLQSAQGRMSSLETLQQAALRQDDAELNQWLRSQQLREAPRLASSLQVENGWEAAVEQVLEGLLKAPLFGDFESRLRNVRAGPRPEESREGKEGGSSCRIRGAP